MAVTYLMSIDPGKSTGVALLEYSETESARLVAGWQFGEGLSGFIGWIKTRYWGPTWGWGFGGKTYYPVETIAEKFQPINHSNYALTTDSVEPLRLEGSLITLGLMPDYTKEEKRWRRPADQYIFGGDSKARKKQLQHKWLKENGFYLTGKDFGTPDADDYRSAAAHGISYLVKVLEHKPTWELVSRVEMREE